MATVDHNVINEITWLNIVHTLMGNFCLESDGKNDTMLMEDMGNDTCVIVGNLRGITTCFISKTVIKKLR
jgi:hypothetical protein